MGRPVTVLFVFAVATSVLACSDEIGGPTLAEIGFAPVLTVGDSVPIGRVGDVAVNGAAGFAVWDPLFARILMYDWAGHMVAMADEVGDGPGEFPRPLSIAAAPDGSIILSEAGSTELVRIGWDGEVQGRLGSYGPPGPPWDLCSSPDGMFALLQSDDEGALWFFDGHSSARAIGLHDDAATRAQDVEGLLHCEAGSIFHLAKYSGRLSAFGADGVRWQVDLEGFHGTDIVSSGRRTRYSIDPKRGSYGVGMVLLSQDTLIVQEWVVGPRRLISHFVSPLDGSYLGRSDRLPRLVASSRQGLLGWTESPEPMITYYRRGER